MIRDTKNLEAVILQHQVEMVIKLRRLRESNNAEISPERAKIYADMVRTVRSIITMTNELTELERALDTAP